MARPLRIEYAGAVYHLAARGNARKRIYKDDHDRQVFLTTLSSVVKKYHWICHAYCLMDNHYHLLIETPDVNLARGMRQLNGVYTQRFNVRHKRPGHIFQGRYKAILVDKDAYLLGLCRYIVLNPVRARCVADVREWKWSSYAATGGFTKTPEYLTIDWILGMFAETRKRAQTLYRKFVTEGVGKESPWKELRGQILLGRESFAEQFRELLVNKEGMEEIPRKQRYADRPELKQIFTRQIIENKTAKITGIHHAHVHHGYTLKEIADYLGIHYTTVSKIVTDAENEN